MTEADANAAYAADTELAPATGHNARAALNFLVQEMFNRGRRVEEAEAALKDAQDLLADVQERKLPDAMQEMGVLAADVIDEHTGEKYKLRYVDKLMIAQPPVQDVAKRDAIYAWLRSIGQGGVIKKTLTIALGQRPDEEVEALVHKIKLGYPGLEPAVAERVEAASFTKLVSKLKADGQNIDPNVSVTPLREARVSSK